jgi:hypothetical protein
VLCVTVPADRHFELRVLSVEGASDADVTGNRKVVANTVVVACELHSLFSSPNYFTMIKSGEMRWSRHAGRMGEMSKRKVNLISRKI